MKLHLRDPTVLKEELQLNKKRVRHFEITNCDLKSVGWTALPSVRFHGARSGDAFRSVEEQQGRARQCRDHACVRQTAADASGESIEELLLRCSYEAS